jgi:uncharacterized protein (TIGR02246 family)
MRTTKSFLAAVAVAVGMGAVCASSASAGSRDEAAIRKLYAHYTAAWNQNDTAAMTKLWAADGDHLEPNGLLVKGRAALEKLLAERFATEFKGSHGTITADAIRFIKSDVAVVDSPYEITGAHDTGGKDLPPIKGRYVDVWARKGGKWEIVVSRPVVSTAQP